MADRLFNEDVAVGPERLQALRRVHARRRANNHSVGMLSQRHLQGSRWTRWNNLHECSASLVIRIDYYDFGR
jgi:hypothetical protein